MASTPAMAAVFVTAAPPEPPVVWADCPMCWAGGLILAEGAWRPCGWCLGVGQVAR